VLQGLAISQRSDFLQVRLSCGGKTCTWLQIAPCDPPPDQGRDRALIAQYLDPRTFLLWLRSVLANESRDEDGCDWDDDDDGKERTRRQPQEPIELGLLPTVEEILKAWARDRSAFDAADEKVASYLEEMERDAARRGSPDEARLLQTFRCTWSTIAAELR